MYSNRSSREKGVVVCLCVGGGRGVLALGVRKLAGIPVETDFFLLLMERHHQRHIRYPVTFHIKILAAVRVWQVAGGSQRIGCLYYFDVQRARLRVAFSGGVNGRDSDCGDGWMKHLSRFTW